jgi:hypothetical protein
VVCVCAVHLGLWELRITRPAHTYVTTPIYPFLCHMLLVECVQKKRMMGEVLGHGLVNYIDNNAKCRHPKKLTCTGALWQVSEAPSPPRFLFGVVEQFCRF